VSLGDSRRSLNRPRISVVRVPATASAQRRGKYPPTDDLSVLLGTRWARGTTPGTRLANRYLRLQIPQSIGSLPEATPASPHVDLGPRVSHPPATRRTIRIVGRAMCKMNSSEGGTGGIRDRGTGRGGGNCRETTEEGNRTLPSIWRTAIGLSRLQDPSGRL
jgi:hypothetical protein